MIQSVPDARRARALTVRTLARAAAVTATALALLTAVLAVLGRDVSAFVVPSSLPFGVPMLWVTAWAYAPGTSLSDLVLPMVFPDGQLPSRRWRPALWAAPCRCS